MACTVRTHRRQKEAVGQIYETIKNISMRAKATQKSYTMKVDRWSESNTYSGFSFRVGWGGVAGTVLKGSFPPITEKNSAPRPINLCKLIFLVY